MLFTMTAHSLSLSLSLAWNSQKSQEEARGDAEIVTTNEKGTASWRTVISWVLASY